MPVRIRSTRAPLQSFSLLIRYDEGLLEVEGCDRKVAEKHRFSCNYQLTAGEVGTTAAGTLKPVFSQLPPPLPSLSLSWPPSSLFCFPCSASHWLPSPTSFSIPLPPLLDMSPVRSQQLSVLLWSWLPMPTTLVSIARSCVGSQVRIVVFNEDGVNGAAEFRRAAVSRSLRSLPGSGWMLLGGGRRETGASLMQHVPCRQVLLAAVNFRVAAAGDALLAGNIIEAAQAGLNGASVINTEVDAGRVSFCAGSGGRRMLLELPSLAPPALSPTRRLLQGDAGVACGGCTLERHLALLGDVNFDCKVPPANRLPSLPVPLVPRGSRLLSLLLIPAFHLWKHGIAPSLPAARLASPSALVTSHFHSSCHVCNRPSLSLSGYGRITSLTSSAHPARWASRVLLEAHQHGSIRAG